MCTLYPVQKGVPKKTSIIGIKMFILYDFCKIGHYNSFAVSFEVLNKGETQTLT